MCNLLQRCEIVVQNIVTPENCLLHTLVDFPFLCTQLPDEFTVLPASFPSGLFRVLLLSGARAVV
jgi:hypothetical protein